MNGAVIAITPGGKKLALRVSAATAFKVFLPEDLWEPGDEAVAFTSLKQVLAESFNHQGALVLIMACGIAVRLLAPLLRDKTSDPAVVVMDEAGQFAISLLSGHWGGANELAKQLGELMDATPVITTATDVNGLQAVDVFAREIGARPEPFALVKDYNAAMLRGEPVAVFTDRPHLRMHRGTGLKFYPLSRFAEVGQRYAYRVLLTNQASYPGSRPGDLYLRPPNLYIGVGCRRGVPASRILAAIRDVQAGNNLAAASVAGLASIDAKRDELGLISAGRELGVPMSFFTTDEILALQAPVQVSSFVHQIMGVGAVCEPTAMLAARSGKLLVTKQKMGGITVAVAEAEYPWWDLDQEEKGL